MLESSSRNGELEEAWEHVGNGLNPMILCWILVTGSYALLDQIKLLILVWLYPNGDAVCAEITQG